MKEYGYLNTRWCWVQVATDAATGHEMVTYRRVYYDEEQSWDWLDPDHELHHAWRNIIDKEGLRILRVEGQPDRLMTEEEIKAAGPRFPDTPTNQALSVHNQSILARIQAARWADMQPGAAPAVGDRIEFRDMRLGIVAITGERCFQPSSGPGDHCCHIGSGGSASYSGGFRSSVRTGVMRPDGRDVVSFWFFSEGSAGAGRGVRCDVEVNRWYLDLPSDYTPDDLEIVGYTPKFNTD